MAADQRYCVNCGSRSGTQRVEAGPVLAALATASLAARQAGELPPVETVEPVEGEGGGGESATSLGARLATRPATFAAMALLTLGVIVGAAFSPPIRNSLAAGQRVIIVQAPGAPAQGPPAAALPAGDPGTSTAQAPTDPGVVDPGPSPTPTPTPPSPTPTPDPPPTPVDPRIGHMMVVLLPGGGAGQSLVASAARVSRGGHASGSVSFASAFSSLSSKGFLLKGFRQVSSSGFANRIALLTGMKPTPEMVAGCTGSVSVVKDGAGCIVPAESDANDLATLATQNLASKEQAIRAYVETPEAVDGDYTGLCHPVAEGVLGGAPADGTPPVHDNPLLWIRGITGEPSDWSTESILCTGKDGRQGMVRPVSMLEDDLRKAFAADSENFDPSIPSNFPLITVIVPSRCRVDASVKCPDGTPGGPEALKRFLDTVIGGTLSTSDLFKKDGAAVVTWDTAPPALSRHGRSALVKHSSASAAATSTLPAVGALVVSPFVKAGGSNTKAYDTYDLMLTLEERLRIASTGPGQTPPLGESATATAFGREVFPAK